MAVAVRSDTVPVRRGVLSFVVREFAVTVGGVVSIVSSFVVESRPMLVSSASGMLGSDLMALIILSMDFFISTK